MKLLYDSPQIYVLFFFKVIIKQKLIDISKESRSHAHQNQYRIFLSHFKKKQQDFLRVLRDLGISVTSFLIIQLLMNHS